MAPDASLPLLPVPTDFKVTKNTTTRRMSATTIDAPTRGSTFSSRKNDSEIKAPGAALQTSGNNVHSRECKPMRTCTSRDSVRVVVVFAVHSAGTRPPSRSCVSTLEDLQDGPKCRNDSCIGHPSAILPEWEAAACSQSAAELLPGSFRAPCATGKLAREARRSRRRLHLAFACAGAVEKRSSANTRHKIPARDRCSAPAPGDRTPRQTFCSQPSGPASSSSLRHICRRPNGMAMDSP